MTTFIYPTVNNVTSPFGWRTHPITRKRSLHSGVDFAKSGYHEIKASASGKVIRSYTSSSYGETIILRHTINGQTWETLYAHMRSGSRKVREGQSVKQGQVIGVMGNTGNSTGQHLHFELHKGTWNINKSNAVNPLSYLGKNLSPKKSNLTVDGKWGNSTTKALQKALGTPQDGIISHQYRNSVTSALYGNTVHFSDTGRGSVVIRELQKKVKSSPDGLLGPNTVRQLQKYLGTVQDGKLSRPSLVVKELQRRLNRGDF